MALKTMLMRTAKHRPAASALGMLLCTGCTFRNTRKCSLEHVMVWCLPPAPRPRDTHAQLCMRPWP